MSTNEPSRLALLESGSKAGLVWADIAIEGKQLTVLPEVATLLLQHYPSLAQHACKNSLFGERLVGALLPHALEHLVIDLLVAQFPGETFAGNTRWLDKSEQAMRVRISAPKSGNSSLVHEAFSSAILQLNGLLEASSRQMS
ncbi:MAG: hypothetical protein FWD27_03670 [Coriobacteriia bacterium]|nr:hypothetical protein [Coriobacteriia bacterium]